MTADGPIEMYWDSEGHCLRPTGGWLGRARRQFAAGEIYHIVQQELRSMASHGHYFAAVESAWKNLPEVWGDRFPTPTHLRKFALIRTGWHNSHTVTCGSRADALRVAAMARALDEYAVVDVPPGATAVTVYMAKSQSARMGKEDFQKSKDEVLGFLADVIGVTPKLLATEGAKA